MALKTLQDIKSIDGFDISTCAEDQKYIHVDLAKNQITFTLQNGPIKEQGVNGCQVDTMIQSVMFIIEKLDSQFPCRENGLALAGLWDAVYWLKARKKDREERGVEGTNQP